MSKKAAFSFQGNQKEFMKIFHELCYSRQPWQVWSDVITMMACSIANTVDRTEGRHQNREREYTECMNRIGSADKPAQLFAVVVNALEENPEQDFLGQMYMCLNLGNHWKGQFFTQYDVCKMMSQITCGSVDSQIEQQGYISICDPACGAGATLMAAANTMKNSKYNFQNHVLFVGQDIDRIVGMMCYIQLSLLGCAGYICIGNSLTNPFNGHVLFPQEKEGQELWLMPMFQTDVWNMRRVISIVKNVCGTATTKKTVEKERYFMFFNFKEQETENGRKEATDCVQ